MNSRPICGKCGGVMTPVNARFRPELFLHDDCLPTELQPQPEPEAKAMLANAIAALEGGQAIIGNLWTDYPLRRTPRMADAINLLGRAIDKLKKEAK